MNPTATSFRKLLSIVSLLVLAATVGCTSTYGPTPLASTINDDIQYFVPGPEFKMANEAAAMRAASEEQAAAQANAPGEAGSTNTQR